MAWEFMVQSRKTLRNMVSIKHMKNVIGQKPVKSYLKFIISLKDFPDQSNHKKLGPKNPLICSDKFYLHAMFV